MSRLQRPLLGLSSARAPILPWNTRSMPMRWPATSANGCRRYTSAMASKRDKEWMVPAMSRDENQIAMHTTAFLIPGTFVPLPLSRAPRQYRAFFTYQWERVKTRFWDVLTMLGLKMSSMPGWTKRPRLKIGRRQIIPTAKALHRLLGDAMASGDKDALREVCVPGLHDTLSGAISRRKRNERFVWELVKYNSTPRIVSHKMVSLPPVQVGPVVQQAVVAIDSVQTLQKYDTLTNRKLSGGAKEQRHMEYVVLTRHIDQKTWKPQPWKIYGNTTESTLDEWLLDKRTMDLQQAQAIRKGR